ASSAAARSTSRNRFCRSPELSQCSPLRFWSGSCAASNSAWNAARNAPRLAESGGSPLNALSMTMRVAGAAAPVPLPNAASMHRAVSPARHPLIAVSPWSALQLERRALDQPPPEAPGPVDELARHGAELVIGMSPGDRFLPFRADPLEESAHAAFRKLVGVVAA